MLRLQLRILSKSFRLRNVLIKPIFPRSFPQHNHQLATDVFKLFLTWGVSGRIYTNAKLQSLQLISRSNLLWVLLSLVLQSPEITVINLFTQFILSFKHMLHALKEESHQLAPLLIFFQASLARTITQSLIAWNNIVFKRKILCTCFTHLPQFHLSW